MTTTKTIQNSEDVEAKQPASWLSKVSEGPLEHARSVLIYGPPGIGKTTAAASFPKPLIVALDDGSDDLDVARVKGVRSLQDLGALIDELKEQSEYKTLVIDGITELEEAVWTFVCKEHGKKNIEDFGFYKGQRSYAPPIWRQLFKRLDCLRAQTGMWVVIVGHDRVENHKDPEAETFQRYVPAIDQSAVTLIKGWCDEVFRLAIDTSIRSTSDGNRKIAISAGDRIVYAEDHPARVAKNRLGLPAEFPLEREFYKSVYAKGE